MSEVRAREGLFRTLFGVRVDWGIHGIVDLPVGRVVCVGRSSFWNRVTYVGSKHQLAQSVPFVALRSEQFEHQSRLKRRFQGTWARARFSRAICSQHAFATLQKAYQTQTSQSTSSSGTTSPVSSDLTTLANALNTGNLSTAQAAFTQLQKDQQAQSGGGHHHHHGGMGGAVQALVSQLSSSSSSSSSTPTTGQTLNVQA